MKTYTYVDVDGNEQTVNVTDRVFDTIEKMNKREELDERRETRRCQSLEVSMENGWDVADRVVDIDEKIDNERRYKRLHDALDTLPKRQRDLVQKIFFEGMTKTEVAKEMGIDVTSVRDRLEVIFTKLKKILKNF